MRHDKINIGKRRLRIGGIAELNLRRLLFEDHFARLGDGLARAVVVIKFQRPQRKTILVCQQHQDNARGEGAAAACDNN